MGKLVCLLYGNTEEDCTINGIRSIGLYTTKKPGHISPTNDALKSHMQRAFFKRMYMYEKSITTYG